MLGFFKFLGLGFRVGAFVDIQTLQVHREPGRQKQCVRLPSELKARSF